MGQRKPQDPNTIALEIIETLEGLSNNSNDQTTYLKARTSSLDGSTRDDVIRQVKATLNKKL